MRWWWWCALAACSGPTNEPPLFTDDELLNPATCEGCHPTHVAQWRGSMHAYAGVDPVFLAMNARGQEETGGELGDLCVRCHAPLALAMGLTADGTNLDEVPEHLVGVGCASCHRAESVHGVANAELSIGLTGPFRGGIPDPVETDAHASVYSPLHDRDDPASSSVCGSCHDVVLPNGLHLERTYLEWRESIFAGQGIGRQSCGHCHMPRSVGPAATDGPERELHNHMMPGVDVALIDFADIEGQRKAVQDALDYTVAAQLCVGPLAGGALIALTLENISAGHRWPSGATHNRRAWVEWTAWDANGVAIGGTTPIGPQVPLADVVDPLRWELHDLGADLQGKKRLHFWEVESLEQRSLAASTTDPTAPHTLTRQWPVQGVEPARVEARLFVRPLGLDLLDDLVASGHLDPAIRPRATTFELQGAHVVWEGEIGSCTP